MVHSEWAHCTNINWASAVTVNRKDGEIQSANSKLESEQALVAQLQKKIKELQVSNLSAMCTFVP